MNSRRDFIGVLNTQVVRSLLLTGSDENATLLFPTVVFLAVPIIFTVGVDYPAFSAGSVKGGGRVAI